MSALVAAMLDEDASRATARARQLGVRRFAAWLADEGEIPRRPAAGVKAPKLDQKVIEPLSDDEIRALIKACMPRDRPSATGATRL